jgi:shikimate kinase
VPFADVDQLIEERTGKLIREIFSDDGEAAFRAIEEQISLEAIAGEGVVSLGGGAVLSPVIRAALASVPVAWLEVSVATATRRAGLNQLRPLLLGDVRARMETLLAERSDLYGQVATLRISTERTTPPALAEAIIEALEKKDS